MLVIKAKHKTNGNVYQFTPTQWYDAQQTNEYNYLGTTHVAEPKQTIQQKTFIPKRGCGCANKRK